MSNAIFPQLAGLGWSVVKAPQWSTKIQTATSGKEMRSAWFSAPKVNFKLTYEVLRADAARAELQALMGFFNARQGSFDSFLYDDPTDDGVSLQSFGTGDGATAAFQLVRAFGGAVEPVMNVNAIAGIFINGTSTSAYTQANGLIMFTTAPASGAVLTWTGSYYYRCRFAMDSSEFDNFMYQLWKLKQLEFVGSLGNKV